LYINFSQKGKQTSKNTTFATVLDISVINQLRWCSRSRSLIAKLFFSHINHYAMSVIPLQHRTDLFAVFCQAGPYEECYNTEECILLL